MSAIHSLVRSRTIASETHSTYRSRNTSAKSLVSPFDGTFHLPAFESPGTRNFAPVTVPIRFSLPTVAKVPEIGNALIAA